MGVCVVVEGGECIEMVCGEVDWMVVYVVMCGCDD